MRASTEARIPVGELYRSNLGVAATDPWTLDTLGLPTKSGGPKLSNLPAVAKKSLGTRAKFLGTRGLRCVGAYLKGAVEDCAMHTGRLHCSSFKVTGRAGWGFGSRPWIRPSTILTDVSPGRGSFNVHNVFPEEGSLVTHSGRFPTPGIIPLCVVKFCCGQRNDQKGNGVAASLLADAWSRCTNPRADQYLDSVAVQKLKRNARTAGQRLHRSGTGGDCNRQMEA